MSFQYQGSFLDKLFSSRSVYSFAQNFLLNTMAGQKLFLRGGDLPRVINLSFNEKTCMFKCKMCPFSNPEVREMYKNKEEMEFSTFVNLVNSIPNDPYYSIDVSAIGETLEYRPLAKCLKYLSRKKPLVKSIISTNAVLLKGRCVDELLTSGLKNIQISLYEGDKDGHEFITQTKAFDRVNENLRYFFKRREELGLTKKDIFIQVFMIGTKENEHRHDDFIEEYSKYSDEAFIRPMYNLGEEIVGMTPHYEETPSENRYPCILPWYATSVRSNGDVLACYAFNWHKAEKDKMVIGNINDNTLQEIYASDKMESFRQAHLSQSLDTNPVCQSCNIWSGYTNIWQKDNNTFKVKPLKIKDFFTPAPEHRGA